MVTASAYLIDGTIYSKVQESVTYRDVTLSDELLLMSYLRNAHAISERYTQQLVT